MKKTHIKLFLGYAILVFFLSSCMIMQQKYERPKDLIPERLYRTDMLPKDSVSTASVSWKEIFTDPVLQGYISKALENNLDIRMAVQNIAVAEAYLKQAKAAYLPTMMVSSGYTFSTSSVNTQMGQIFGERRFTNQLDITASVGWEADIWGKITAQKKAQYASYLGTVAAHQAVKSTLVTSIATAYYQLLAFDEQKKIIEETIVIRQKNLETTKALKDAGTLTEIAVQQSQALVYNAQALLINLDIQMTQLENFITLLMGESSHKIERSTLAQQQLNLNPDLGYPVSLLDNRPDVKQAEYALMNAFELSNVAKADFYPSLRLTDSGGLQSVDIDHLFSVKSLFANVVAGLAQPILNKRQMRTNYEISLANKEKAYLQFRKTVLTAGKEVSDALKSYTEQDQFIHYKEQELEAYAKAAEYSKELMTYGMANYLDVLNADISSLNAKMNIANAQYNKLEAGVQLYKALGGGWR